DLEKIKSEVKSGNILIIKVEPLAEKSIEDVKRAISELSEFVESIGGDIARLGEERIVLTPPNVQIWKEKSPTTTSTVPT
ncbi:MAG: cell division protein SepF, partial [Candidatus Bathyarchaeia archaeon]